MSDDTKTVSSSPWPQQAQQAIQQVVLGQEAAVQSLLVAFAAGGHVLLEGVPGVAKTLLARCLAAVMRCSFARIQFTPDLMPSDITGVNVFEPRTNEFRFRPGPVFADLVLADEINRAPAKTQAALLEAMQERQVSIDGEPHPLSPAFTVVATQNPIEYEGTYPLPEAQLDRFLMKVWMGYPNESEERLMLQTMHDLGERSMHPLSAVTPVATPDDLQALRRQVQTTRADSAVLDYILALTRQSRELASVGLGASPRAGVMLLHAAKALAVLRGRDYVIPEDIQAIAYPVLRHRLQLTPEAEIEGLTPDKCIAALLAQVAVPR
ncbi:MAG TPA: MoxR family ATPase [Verrucomicrobiota bacterium]|nr:MoxR family ATPase [Verrucomicrobiota bacterium]HNU52038.1 MoxR family ATPase [Verrucomicrobiota bacterium]